MYPNPYDHARWESPENYGGFNPVGDFFIHSVHRDSNCLDRSNHEAITEIMEGMNKDFDPRWIKNDGLVSGDERFFYTFRARHWAVGWVEYLMLRQDAPDEMQAKAYDLLAALANYPLLDDERYSAMQMEEAEWMWDSFNTRDRIEVCAKAGVSIFAARDEVAPPEVMDLLIEDVQ